MVYLSKDEKPTIYLLGLILLFVVGLAIYKAPKSLESSSSPTLVIKEDIEIIAENLKIPWEIANRVERYTLLDDILSNRVAIIEGIGGSRNHNGGRIAFGPDGHLYISTSNRDGRGLASSADDKIIKINPGFFIIFIIFVSKCCGTRIRRSPTTMR